jgi:hypothetical protein
MILCRLRSGSATAARGGRGATSDTRKARSVVYRPALARPVTIRSRSHPRDRRCGSRGPGRGALSSSFWGLARHARLPTARGRCRGDVRGRSPCDADGQTGGPRASASDPLAPGPPRSRRLSSTTPSRARSTPPGLSARSGHASWGEGVFSYLTVDAIDATLRWVVDACAPGSRLILTYVDAAALRPADHPAPWIAAVDRAGEPFVTGLDPSAAEEFFAARGSISSPTRRRPS